MLVWLGGRTGKLEAEEGMDQAAAGVAIWVNKAWPSAVDFTEAQADSHDSPFAVRSLTRAMKRSEAGPTGLRAPRSRVRAESFSAVPLWVLARATDSVAKSRERRASQTDCCASVMRPV